ncbi:MAG: hypothetical protein ACREDL_02315 [Bradyrhizobium sp.]
MRITQGVFAVSVAALAALATPVLAKQYQPRMTDGKSSASSCSAYQMAPNGSWTKLPCVEEGAARQPEAKSATRSVTRYTR